MCDLYLYENGQRTGVIEDMISLQWLECYQEAGEFCLVVRASSRNIAGLSVGNILYKTDGITAGVIERVQIDDDTRTGKITARGHLSAGLLSRRVVLATENIENAEEGMYALVSKNLRGLGIQPGQPRGLAEALQTQVSWGEVLTGVSEIAKASGLGFRCRFEPYTAAHIFEVYRGADRSEGKDGYTGYFGDDIGNLTGLRIIEDDSGYKNIAVVAGEGSGSARKVVFAGPAQSDRRELYVDARDLQSVYSTATDTGEKDSRGNPVLDYQEHTYTAGEYESLLTARGEKKLADRLRVSTFAADIQDGPALRYRTDFNVGDIVTVKSAKYGITQNVRLTQVKEIYEQSGYRIAATLGNTD